MPWMPWKNARHLLHPVTLLLRAEDEDDAEEADDAQEADDDEDEAGFKIQRWPRMVDIVA